MLCLLEVLPPFLKLRSEVLELKSRGISISRQLGAWADSLQNSKIKGQRYMTDKTRRASQASREREEFLEELQRMQEERIAKMQGGGSEDERANT